MSPHTLLPAPAAIIERSSSPASTLPPADDTVMTPLSPTTPAPKNAIHHKIVRWAEGPVPPQDVTFKPLFPELQLFPARLLRRGPLKHRKWRLALLVVFWLLWFVAFVIVVHSSRFRSEVEGAKANMISCSATLWLKNNRCGIDGYDCRPFENYTVPFRCPAQCASTHVFNPRVVGDQRIAFQQFVIGGPTDNMTHSAAEDINAVYRADSFICSSAIHAGIISDKYGGCGIFSMVGENHNFPASKKHGISSTSFDSGFPSSFTFLPGISTSHCKDLRWHLLAVSLTFTTLLSVFTTSPLIFFASVFPGVFFHVALGSDPVAYSNPYDLVSLSLSRFLPASFVAFVMFKYVVLYTLSLQPTANIERTILWLGPLWIGALTNITLDPHIPINRLTSRDIKQQPGAVSALVIICLIIACLVILQAHYFRLEGRMPKYLALYGVFGSALGFLAAIPGSSLRIHHYILGLVLLPGTKLRTRASLVFSGLLVGLFINGIARWGFAGIIETPESLRGDGLYYSTLPTLVPPEVGISNATFAWQAGKKVSGWEEGVSVLINDVERFMVDGLEGEVTWNRTKGESGQWEKIYIRVGYYGNGEAGDYTLAGVLEANGTWVEPRSGRS